MLFIFLSIQTEHTDLAQEGKSSISRTKNGGPLDLLSYRMSSQAYPQSICSSPRKAAAGLAENKPQREGGKQRSDLCAQKSKAFQSSSLCPTPVFVRAEQRTRACHCAVNGQSVPPGNTQQGTAAWGQREGEGGECV